MNFYPNFGAPDFLSPVSGRILCDYNYILMGNYQNIATPSPILIDIRLDLASLLENLANTDFVIGHPKSYLPRAQVLVSLANGYMYNTDGIVSTKSLIPPGDIGLLKGHILVGNDDNKATDTPFPKDKLATGDTDNRISFVDNITLAQMAPLATNKLWSGNSSGRPAEVDKIILDQMADLTSGKVWQGNGSNRPAEVTITEAGAAPGDATYYIREPNSALPNAQSLRDLFYLIYPIPDPTDLGEGALAWMMGITEGALPGNHVAKIRKARSSLLNPLDDYISPAVFLAEFWTTEWLPLVAEVAAIQAELVLIEAAIVALQAQTADLYIKAARPLNVIATDNPTSGDVSFNNYKLTMLADPTNPQDGVNLRTLNSDKASAGLFASASTNAISPSPVQLTLAASPNISSTNFTTNPSSLVYTGTADINVVLLLTCQIEADIAGEAEIDFYINGFSFTGGKCAPYLNTTNSMVVLQASAKLETGDEVTVWGSSLVSTNWIMKNISWTVHSIGAA